MTYEAVSSPNAPRPEDPLTRQVSGASWLPGMRPGWGSLALCGPCGDGLSAEQKRHADVMRALTAVNFEQPLRSHP